jgi:tRNA dimethylallyltransferase
VDARGEKPSVVFFFGPTASGKTALLIDLFNNLLDTGGARGEVISADSMQVYKYMDIGTAKPTPTERAALPHHLIDLKKPDEGYHVGEFVKRAERLVREINARDAVPVIAGGTAFYFNVFLFGLPGTPEASEETRALLQGRLEREGLQALRRELEERDPSSAECIAPGDTYRNVRALEVLYESGHPRSAFAIPTAPRHDMRILTVGLYREREELYRRINARVEEMMEAGLPGEVRRLAARGYRPPHPGMRAIGYREFYEPQVDAPPMVPDARGARAPHQYGRTAETQWLLRDIDTDGADITEEIQRNSRRYAKRQLTFFRKLPGVQWFEPEEADKIAEVLGQFRSGTVS